MKNYSVTLFIISFVISCSTLMNSQDTTGFVIPKRELRNDMYDIVLKVQKDLQLSSLQNTNSELCIRIWYFPMRLSRLMMTSLELKNDEWKGKLFLYSFNGTDSIVSNSISNDIVPKSGWLNLIDKIQRYGIFVLPDHSKLDLDVDQIIDGLSLLVEVVDNKNYRFYSYFNPDEFASESFENDCMSKIISLLDEEFNLEKAYRDYKPKY